MDLLAARYPFLAAARQAVEEADTDLAELVRDGDGPELDRAITRVESAIESGSVGAPHPQPRTELLSYPIARVLVSLVDEPGLTRRYARAEAEAAIARFQADREQSALKSVDREPLTLDRLLTEFAMSEAVERDGDGFAVEVATYLGLTEDLADERWRLVARELSSGAVPVTEDEFHELLREAIYDRVAEGLPLSVPDAIAESLDQPVAAIRSQLADHGVDWEFDVVDPALFPPCIEALLDRAASEGPLPAHSRFALVTFLANVGMPGEVIVERLASHPSLSAEAVAALIDHVRDETGAAYPPPSCATMVAYGDCVNRDALCARIGHPLEYYQRRLDGVDPDQLEAEA